MKRMLATLCIVVPIALVGLTSFHATLAAASVSSPLVEVFELVPGQSAMGAIVATNGDSQPAEVRLYQTDYSFLADGRSSFGSPGVLPRSNASWVNLPLNAVTIPPKSAVSIPYRVEAPQGSLKGTYWSLVMVEGVAPGQKSPNDQPSITSTIRYAIQVIIEFKDRGIRLLKIINPNFSQDAKGGMTLQVDLQNEGDCSLRPKVSLELYDQQGTGRPPVEGTKTRIYPGCSTRQTLALGELPPGNYQAVLIADNGDSYVVGARYKLAVKAR